MSAFWGTISKIVFAGVWILAALALELPAVLLDAYAGELSANPLLMILQSFAWGANFDEGASQEWTFPAFSCGLAAILAVDVVIGQFIYSKAESESKPPVWVVRFGILIIVFWIAMTLWIARWRTNFEFADASQFHGWNLGIFLAIGCILPIFILKALSFSSTQTEE